MNFPLKPSEAVTLVVDMQRLFTEPGSPYQNNAESLIAPINRLTERSRELGIPVIHSAYTLAEDASDAGLISDWPHVQSGFHAANSPWTDWDPRLDKQDGDHEHSRPRPGAFWGGGLDALLKELGKEQILLAGLSLNNALAFTAHEAFSRDIPVFVVRDTTALAPFEKGKEVDIHLNALGTWASEIVSLDELFDRLGSTAHP